MTEPYRELLLGCGRSREKRMWPAGSARDWRGLVTLDHNADVKPDLLCDLDESWEEEWRLKSDLDDLTDENYQIVQFVTDRYRYLRGDCFDEVHAYEVLEHLGDQGDYRAFFHHFSEIWRILKPGGYLCATVPSRYSGWLWGDPSHRRAILPESLVFLDQSEYVRQCDAPHPTSMSDFRYLYKADFRCVEQGVNREQFQFILQAVKPSRWRAPA